MAQIQLGGTNRDGLNGANLNFPLICEKNLPAIPDNQQERMSFTSSFGTPKASDTYTLNYNGYVYASGYADDDDSIYWEFSGTNTAVGITVQIMTSENFNYMQNSQEYERYQVSDGSYYEDSGEGCVEDEATWYVVWFNWDADMASTTLTYYSQINYDTCPSSSTDGDADIDVEWIGDLLEILQEYWWIIVIILLVVILIVVISKRN